MPERHVPTSTQIRCWLLALVGALPAVVQEESWQQDGPKAERLLHWVGDGLLGTRTTYPAQKSQGDCKNVWKSIA